ARAATGWRSREAPPGGRRSALALLRSSRCSLEYGDPGVALEPEGEGFSVFRVFQHGNHLLAELPGRHRRAEAGQERFGLDAHRVRISVGAGVANASAANDLLRHDCLEADPEMLLLRDAVGVFGHEPEALGAAIATRHRRSV